MLLTSTMLLSFMIFLSFSFLSPKMSKSKMTTNLMKMGGGGGMIAGLYWILLDCPSFMMTLAWVDKSLQEFTLSVMVDYYFVIFGAVALVVTWSIVEFSHYYMSGDPKKQAFFNTLMLFLLFMLLLVCSKSLFLLFMGWEGVGILSFILMGWWFTRSDAKSAALQAMIYNRVGDTGMMLFIVLSMIHLKSWKLKEMMFMNQSSNLIYPAMMGIMMAAVGKSAQFSLHPWLPAAMEGPTPVSALLHSSTMVVAGVFLLVRTFPLLKTYTWSLTLIALMGSLTALFAASAALFQYDMKKVVAYSTTSQLGLMVTSVGLGLPWLALFHICTHAFFKALLFLCSGSMIHSLNNEQDLRKMGKASVILPFTTSTLVIGSLALCGMPFLAGYYSKDLILEAAQYKASNTISVFFAILATLMTAAYSSRLIFFLSSSRASSNSMNPMSEEDHKMINPLLRLLVGVFLAGWFFSFTSFHSSSFVVPLLNKSLPLMVTVAAGLYLFFFSAHQHKTKSLLWKSVFLGSNWFFVHLTHALSFFSTLKMSLSGVLRSLDQGWTINLGPATIPKFMGSMSSMGQRSQTGNMVNYTLYLMVLVSLLIITSLFNLSS